MDVHLSSPYRNLVVGIDNTFSLPGGTVVHPINFDNASTTPPFASVVNDIVNFAPFYGSVHRGTGLKAEYSMQQFESARKVVLDFVGGDSTANTVIFVKNTTEGINKLAFRLQGNDKQAVVLCSSMEHHSNDLPWRDKYKVDYIAVDPFGKLLLEDLEMKLRKYKGTVKLVTVTGASNVTGYVNPIHEIAELAHRYGALIHVDGAQLVPHCPVDLKTENSPQHIDFLTFSAHKMYAPFGIGVLIGPKSIFQKGAPEYSGGGTVQRVTRRQVVWAVPPHKDEAGTPNTMGVIALVSAIRTMTKLGLSAIYKYESNLHNYTLQGLQNIPRVKIYSRVAPGEPQLGIIPFNIHGIDHAQVAQFLARQAGISVRNGCFCAQSYVRQLLGISSDVRIGKERELPGMVRISFGLYNNYHEVNVLLNMVRRLAISNY